MGLLEPGNCFRMDQRAESRSDEGSSKVKKESESEKKIECLSE